MRVWPTMKFHGEKKKNTSGLKNCLHYHRHSSGDYGFFGNHHLNLKNGN